VVREEEGMTSLLLLLLLFRLFPSALRAAGSPATSSTYSAFHKDSISSHHETFPRRLKCYTTGLSADDPLLSFNQVKERIRRLSAVVPLVHDR
jgi:hypothetical protein